METKLKFTLWNRETGVEIDEFDTLQEAEKALAAAEAMDKKEGNFEENSYEIIWSELTLQA